jgi:hypothetical protein
MPTRLTAVVIDSSDPTALANWWAEGLGWRIDFVGDGECDVVPPAGEPGIELTFVQVEDDKQIQNRVHLDLRSESPSDQAAIVARLTEAGARPIDIGQADVPWVVLADPEGNEFCVLEPRAEYGQTGSIAAVVVVVLDTSVMVQFWAQASGLSIVAENEKYAALRSPDGLGPWLEFIATGEPHTVKNRLHLDVAPFADDDQIAEVSRLMNLGALRIEIGQSKSPADQISWVVLSDPEDNEFCVLSSRA